MEKKRVVLMLDADATEILEQSTTERGKGAYVSKLIRQAIEADTGILERIESRLARIEELIRTNK